MALFPTVMGSLMRLCGRMFMRNVLFTVPLSLGWTQVHAQTAGPLRAIYDRAVGLFVLGDAMGLSRMSDSLVAASRSDDQILALAGILKAASLRYSGNGVSAFNHLDSIQLDTSGVDPLLRYALYNERARIFKSLMLFEEAQRDAGSALEIATVT
jgi:hypothetical protein